MEVSEDKSKVMVQEMNRKVKQRETKEKLNNNLQEVLKEFKFPFLLKVKNWKKN